MGWIYTWWSWWLAPVVVDCAINELWWNALDGWAGKKRSQKNCAKTLAHMHHYYCIGSLYTMCLPVGTTIQPNNAYWKKYNSPCDAPKHSQVHGCYCLHHILTITSATDITTHGSTWVISLQTFVPNSGTHRFFTGTLVLLWWQQTRLVISHHLY